MSHFRSQPWHFEPLSGRCRVGWCIYDFCMTSRCVFVALTHVNVRNTPVLHQSNAVSELLNFFSATLAARLSKCPFVLPPTSVEAEICQQLWNRLPWNWISINHNDGLTFLPVSSCRFFFVNWNVSTTIEWTAMTFGSDPCYRDNEVLAWPIMLFLVFLPNNRKN